MLGFISLTPHHQTQIPSTKPLNPLFPYPNSNPSINFKKFKTSFSENKQQINSKEEEEEEGQEDLKKKDERPRLNLKWSELLFDPDPNNVVAVGLTGVLSWASVQVLWQLFVISFAILIAALLISFLYYFTLM